MGDLKSRPRETAIPSDFDKREGFAATLDEEGVLDLMASALALAKKTGDAGWATTGDTLVAASSDGWFYLCKVRAVKFPSRGQRK